MSQPRYLTTQDILPLAVSNADQFRALMYLRHRAATPRLQQIEEEGQVSLPGTEGALLDLNQCLWDSDPEVQDEGATPPARRYWRSILGQALETASYEELHATTQLSELFSVLGTIGMAEEVIKLVPDEDKKKLQELNQAQRDADEARDAAEEAQAEADALQQLANQMQAQANGQGVSGDGGGDGEGQPGDGSASSASQSGTRGNGQAQPGANGSSPSFTFDKSAPQAPATSQVSLGQRMTAAQAQALADQIARAASEAKAKAQAACETARTAQGLAEMAADALLGATNSPDAQAKSDELARLGLAALKAAKDQIQDVSDMVQGWGLDPAELTSQGMPEALAILERIKSNPALKKFAQILGRMRQIAARKARTKVAGEGRRVSRTDTGRDLKRAHRSELVALSTTATRPQALQRWARGELRLQGTETKSKLGHGPVVVCEDASGSMDGTKQQWAKALVLAMAHYAKLQRRSFGWVLFDSWVHKAQTYLQGRLTAHQMLEIADARAGGGTDFERPLRKALEMIQKEGLKKADILFITDGECAVSETFLREFLAAKQSLEFTVVTLLCDVGDTTGATVEKFSDRVERISTFSLETAESAVFRHF